MSSGTRQWIRSNQMRFLVDAVITLSLPFEAQSTRLAPFSDWASDLQTDLADPLEVLQQVGYDNLLTDEQWRGLQHLLQRVSDLVEHSESATREAIATSRDWDAIRHEAAQIVASNGWSQPDGRASWYRWSQ
jgi:hypothetical protein